MATLDKREDTLQLKYARLGASGTSRIPVKDKTRQVSTPIQPLDDTFLGFNVKRSSIPRITSSPIVHSPVSSTASTPGRASLLKTGARRTSLSPLVNVVNTGTSSREQHLTPKGKILSESRADTPPSTVSKLTSQLAALSITTPSPTRTKDPQQEPGHRVTRSTTREIPDLQHAMDKSKTRSTRKLQSEIQLKAQGTKDTKLENRTSTLLRARVRSVSSTQSPSPVKKTLTRKASVQASPSPVKRYASTARPKPVTITHDSPLLSRLTRSTTAFNLKSTLTKRAQRTFSEVSTSSVVNSSTTNIPQAKNIPNRVVSERPDLLRRSTRSSRLKQEASIMNLNAKIQNPKTVPEATTTDVPTSNPTADQRLHIPKKRSMTKSFSVSVGLKDLTPVPDAVPQPIPHTTQRRVVSTRPRPLSTIYTPRVSSRSSTPTVPAPTKCKLPDQLHKILSEFSGTKRAVEDWDTSLEVKSRPRQSPSQVLQSEDLNTFERAEIIKNDEVFYWNDGHQTVDPSNFGINFGFDDKENNLLVQTGDHINYRYQVLGKLGTGMFGKVYKCHDHKCNTLVSVKIMRNDPEWSLQSINEIKILKQLHHKNLLAYIEYFNFRSHICITTELLSVTLLEALEATKYKGFDISVIKLWSKQLLSGLESIHKQGIIHGDLKPENIMLASPHSFDLKIIDFGSSATSGNITFPYIQSRFYRAPEVLLGCRYDTKIDIWSFASLIFEMYSGDPMFEAKDEENLYKLVVKLIGHPTAKTVITLRNGVFQKGSINKYNNPEYIDKKTMIFTKFDRIGSYKGPVLEVPRRDAPMYKKLKMDNAVFGTFLQSMLIWNPHDRPDATKLLAHDFLKDA